MHSEDVIRAHWQAAARSWPEGHQQMKVPVHNRVAPPFSPEGDISTDRIKEDILTYELEHGYIDDVPMARVVCEGVVLTSWERKL